MAKIIKMKDLIKKEGIKLGKIYTDKDRPPFKVNEKTSYKQIGTNKNDGYILHGKDIPEEELSEGNMKIGKGKFANLYKIKEDMKEGKFDPKDPQVHIHGLGVYTLKLLEKVIKRDLTKAANDLGGELGAKNLNIHLYGRHIPLGSKIKGLYEVYQQMNSPAYKRAVTLYKKR
jgi:hypothetical protein